MKYHILLLISLAFSINRAKALTVPEPETIYPLTRMIKPLAYYEEQAQLWQAVTLKSPDRTDGWWNFYLAVRNIQALHGTCSYTSAQIAADAQTAIAGTFEQYYLAFGESPQENRSFDLLLKAHEKAPERPEAFPDLLTYYELQQNDELLKAYCKRLMNSGYLSSGILDWNYNMLASVGADGILLTQGDNDTYPAWVLQQVYRIRHDVQILNVPLLLNYSGYRGKIFRQLGIPDWTPPASDAQTSLYRHLFQTSGRPVYLVIGAAAPRQFGPDYFFITGLAMRYSEQDFDNLSQIRQNYEQRYRLDGLRYTFAQDPAQSVVDQINMNYLPSMALLNRHYLAEGAVQKAEGLQQLALQIGEKAGQKQAVIRHFAPPAASLQPAQIDLRPLQKQLQQVDIKLYASSFEVSNAEYELFLKDLLEQAKFDLLEKYKMHRVDWRGLLPSGMQVLSDDVLYGESGHPEGPDMPVVNISFEAAEAYCEWLTAAYNHAEDRRKQFKKVRFRLPTEAEWEKAARAGRDHVPYPWGGYYTKNSKGCYLANVNPYLNVYDEQTRTFSSDRDAESPGEDSAFFPAKVDSYFPNDLQLYNMSGNAAEMVQERDFTKGGSWLEAVYYAQIGNRHFQPIPSPSVGFRIFMEVLEEK